MNPEPGTPHCEGTVASGRPEQTASGGNFSALLTMATAALAIISFAFSVMVLLRTGDLSRQGTAAITEEVARIEARLAAVERQLDSSPPPQHLTTERIKEYLDLQFEPVLSQVGEALDRAVIAEETARDALANPPVAVFGKDAILFTEAALQSIRSRIDRLEQVDGRTSTGPPGTTR